MASTTDKELATESKDYTPSPDSPVHDVERDAGDKGIINRASPLARELKGRHMQMIAIGMIYSYGHYECADYSQFRWCYWCRSVRRLWKCAVDWWACEFGMNFYLMIVSS